MNYNTFINKYSAILLLFLFVAGFTSCKKFLETKQYDTSNEAAFYKSAADFDQALIGAHSTFGSLYHPGSFLFLMTDIRSDNTSVYVPGGASGPLSKSEYDDFTLTSNNEHLEGFWNVSYSLIQKANDILAFIEGVEMSAELKDRYNGEAKALRGIAYFNLVRLWGDVPLVLKRFDNIDDSYKQGRNAAEEVYTQIINDLTSAATLLVKPRNTGADVGRIDKGAVLSILGEVYLTRKNYSQAAATFKELIDLNAYSLLPNYFDLFAGGQQGNSEAILQALYTEGVSGLGSIINQFCAPLESQGVLVLDGQGLPFGWNQPTNDIANAYTAGDVRRNAISDGFTKNGTYYPYKYINVYMDVSPNAGNGNSGKDWYVMRYADVLLRYAEAVNEEEGPANAYASVNLVRARAGLSPLPAGLSKDEFRDAVYLEERLESPFEGKRWFDLLRTGRTLSVMNAKVKLLSDPDCVGLASPINEHNLLLPIAQTVMTAAPAITQNAGY
ncbi:MAG: RagB/SusD family nutrient uptake outer membrane protein [Agriterribacter sp.]